MRTEQEIKDKLAELYADERLSYPSATTDENSVLALIQVELESKALKWVLDIKG